MSTPSPEHRTRTLTPREQEALITLLERGTDSGRESAGTAADRARWLAQVPGTRAGRPCGCGSCPSIGLTDAAGRTPATGDGRTVLNAGAPGALLMLVIDEDRLSYLELAPLEDGGTTTFPSSTDIDTT